jgi:hypothetical protein
MMFTQKTRYPPSQADRRLLVGPKKLEWLYFPKSFKNGVGLAIHESGSDSSWSCPHDRHSINASTVVAPQTEFALRASESSAIASRTPPVGSPTKGTQDLGGSIGSSSHSRTLSDNQNISSSLSDSLIVRSFSQSYHMPVYYLRETCTRTHHTLLLKWI